MPHEQPNQLSQELVAELLLTAPTKNALIQEAQLIQHVPGISQQTRLGSIFKKRYDQLKKGK